MRTTADGRRAGAFHSGAELGRGGRGGGARPVPSAVGPLPSPPLTKVAPPRAVDDDVDVVASDAATVVERF